MRRIVPLLLAILLMVPSPGVAGFFDDVLRQFAAPEKGNDEQTVVSGLKEALRVGTGNAVRTVSVEDGFFGNPRIRIPVPDKLEKAENLLRKVGMGKYADEFILSMNRAAESAAPQAADIFLKAIRQMTVRDAFGILKGSDTAATDYFEGRTRPGLYDTFRPTVSQTMGEAEVVKSYRGMMKKYTSLPFVREEPVDLEDYVTNEALDGLFFMVGEEEKKIRKDPAARVTDLLRQVFGK